MIDDVDRLAALGTAHPSGGVLMLLRAAAVHPHLRVVLVCETRYYRRLGMYVEDLVEQLVPIRLDSLTEEAVRDVVQRTLPTIESEHGVRITAALHSLARLPARSTDAAAHPGLAIDRLDAAASNASVQGSKDADVAKMAGLASHSSRPMPVRERLAESGWSVTYDDDDVVKHLVTTGYDPAYGARHLHRNIERIFLALIAQSDDLRVTVRVADGELVRQDHE